VQEYTVRELKPSDFESLIDTFYSFFDEAKADPSFGLVLHHEKPSMADEHRWFADFLSQIERGNALAVVAEAGHQVVGMCDIRRRMPKSAVAHRGELGLFVRKGYRGRGIGESLMRKAIELASGKFECIELAVFSNNEPAKKLYRKMGFRTIGNVPKAIKRGDQYFDEDVMILFI